MENTEIDPYVQSRQRAERHAEIVKQLESQQAQGQSVQQAGPHPAVQVSQADLAWLAKQQASTDSEGRRRYDIDSGFRERLERARMAVCRGESIYDVRQATEKSLQQRGEAAPAASDENAYISPADVSPGQFREISGGYDIADLIPAGHAIGPVESELLKAAKASGVDAQTIRNVVANVVRSQQK